MHTHTFHSACSSVDMSPAAIIREAETQGIEYVGITDHIHKGTDPSFLGLLRADINSIETSCKVYLGCEADLPAVGESLVSPYVLANTDFIMVAANHFHHPAVVKPASASREDVARLFLDMFTYAVSLEYVDVIAHPLYVMPGSYNPLAPSLLTEKDLAPAIELAVKNQVAMEISRRALMPEQRPFLVWFYKLCKEAGVKFSIGSDGHRICDVGRTELVEPIVSELGLDDSDIWLPALRTAQHTAKPG